VGRRKRLLRLKRQHKREKAAMAALKYRMTIKVRKFMEDHGDMYLERLMKTVAEKNPLAVAVVAYQAFRESPAADELRDNKAKYDDLASKAIMSMGIILDNVGWDISKIEEFVIRSKELAGLK
jgi:hypothetical protein